MELKDIKKLSPEERIERLKKIAEKDKKEIEEAQELIKESETEIKEERKEKENIPIPQLRAADISELTGQQEKEMFKAKRYEGERPAAKSEEEQLMPLEETIEQEEVTEEARREAESGQYFRSLTTEQLNQRAGELYDMTKQNENFYLTSKQQNEEENIYNELKRREEDNTGESYNRKVAGEIDTGQRILDALGRNYKKAA